jgi:hypothetical protein
MVALSAPVSGTGRFCLSTFNTCFDLESASFSGSTLSPFSGNSFTTTRELKTPMVLSRTFRDELLGISKSTAST